MGLGATWSSGKSHWLQLDDFLGPSLPKTGLCADSQYLSNCGITVCIQKKGNAEVATCLPLQQAEFSKFLLPLLVSVVNSRLPGGNAELQLDDQLKCFGDFCFIDTRGNNSAVSKEKDCSSSFSFLPLSNPWEQSRGVEVSRIGYVSAQTALQKLQVQSLSQLLFLSTFNKSSASPSRFMWNRRSILPTAYSQDILGISWNNLLVVAKSSSATRNILLQELKTSCFFKDFVRPFTVSESNNLDCINLCHTSEPIKNIFMRD